MKLIPMLLAAAVMVTAVPASAATHQAEKKAVFSLTRLSGPKVGKIFTGQAVVKVKDLDNGAKVERATKVVTVRLPYSKTFKVKRGTCAIVAVGEGVRGAKLRLKVTVGGVVQTSQKAKAPSGVYCNG
ncbi:hypothetical protein [Nonomuraea cavernae]|uniref:hypothetical protein n=1 Tax=Nonomuraea cavernae TaxID=2045107 RepID=UPI0033D4642C